MGCRAYECRKAVDATILGSSVGGLCILSFQQVVAEYFPYR